MGKNKLFGYLLLGLLLIVILLYSLGFCGAALLIGGFGTILIILFISWLEEKTDTLQYIAFEGVLLTILLVGAANAKEFDSSVGATFWVLAAAYMIDIILKTIYVLRNRKL